MTNPWPSLLLAWALAQPSYAGDVDPAGDGSCSSAGENCKGAKGEDTSCCPTGSWPALQTPDDYKPRGVEDLLGDLPVYRVGTPGPKAVIVFPEVFGWAGRLKGICDTLADEGFFVVMPDHHRGDTAAGKANIAEWVSKTPYSTVVGPDIERLMNWLVEQGVESVGAFGFCWGAWALSKASAQGVPLRCGVAAHPSTRLETVAFGGNELDMMQQVRMSILLLPAGNDPPTLKTGGEVANAVIAKGGRVVEFPKMQHGWVSRGDISDASVKADVEAALAQAAVHLGSCI